MHIHKQFIAQIQFPSNMSKITIIQQFTSIKIKRIQFCMQMQYNYVRDTRRDLTLHCEI